jgi:tetratricopeptide (TPR) repeat protein
MADTYFRLSTNYLPLRATLPKAKAAVIHALEIDPDLAEAHASLGMVRMRYDWDWDGAGTEFKRAIELKFNYATAHHWYSIHLESLGRFDEALAEMKVAKEMDPLSLQIKAGLATTLWKMRLYDRALEELLDALSMDRNCLSAHFVLGVVYEQIGDFSKAVEELGNVSRLGETSMTSGFLGHVYAISGKRHEARQILEALEAQAKKRNVSAYSVALIHAGLGDIDSAFIWLERAYEERDELLTWLSTDPRLDNLRADRRTYELMGRIGLKPLAARA